MITTVIAIIAGNEYYVTPKLWQWDYGQILRLQGKLPNTAEIHFSLSPDGKTDAITRIGINTDGIMDIPIPDSTLEGNRSGSDYNVYAYVYLTDSDSGQTVHRVTIPIQARPKPETYTGSGQTTLGQILETVQNIASAKADGLEYADSVLRLMSGDTEIARVTITGGSGSGSDGREVELRKGDTALQWRYTGADEWTDLIGLSDLTGPAGPAGPTGPEGPIGPVGPAGKDGVDGSPGVPGVDGLPGKDGTDGLTPRIGDNGNWYLGDTDTGKPSRGDTGPTGPAGQDGKNGADGVPGKDGNDGAPGKSAYQYAQDAGYTGTESEFSNRLAAEIPTALPNPQKLTFSGAVSAEYDGSGAVTVEIPTGGETIDVDSELREYYTTAKQGIRTAIENKGVSVADTDSLGSYATKIGQIPSAVNPTETLPEQTQLVAIGLQETLGIELRWQDVGAAGYLINRKETGYPASTADGDTVCNVTSNTYTDTNVSRGKTYYYRIFPYNSQNQYQAAESGSTVSIEYKDRTGQKTVGDLEDGDVVKFGTYSNQSLFWEVKDTLDKPDGMVHLACRQNGGNKQFDAPENATDNANPVTNRKNQGNNRWAYSNIRQWLNSAAEKGQWYVAQHDYDVAPNYSGEAGFLHDFTEYERNAIMKRKVKCVLDANDGGGSETVEDKIWLVSTYEVGGEVTVPTECSHVFSGFSDAASRSYTGNYWTRTIIDASTGTGKTASGVRYVGSGGGLNGNSANGGCAARPFCSLPVGLFVIWSDTDQAYIFADDSQQNQETE